MSETNPMETQAPDWMIEKKNHVAAIVLKGDWTLQNLASFPDMNRKIAQQALKTETLWALDSISALDSAGAWAIWQGWGQKIPTQVVMRPEQQRLFERWKNLPPPLSEPASQDFTTLFVNVRKGSENFGRHIVHGIEITGQLVLDLMFLLKHPGKIPWAEISGTIYTSGVRALGITALVGFLIGIVLSYLSALQLQSFGAEIYIINILGLSIIRELGPLLAAILIAGRSGSAMTAQLGIMRVTEELDALSAMGISHSLRLILPKVMALAITLPLITVWTDMAALIGGMLSAHQTLDISTQQFFLRLPDSVPLANVFIGIGKAAVFGVLIALIACHFGFLIKPNTESLGNETTNSVVASITAVIMADAVFAILFMHTGMP